MPGVADLRGNTLFGNTGYWNTTFAPLKEVIMQIMKQLLTSITSLFKVRDFKEYPEIYNRNFWDSTQDSREFKERPKCVK